VETEANIAEVSAGGIERGTHTSDCAAGRSHSGIKVKFWRFVDSRFQVSVNFIVGEVQVDIAKVQAAAGVERAIPGSCETFDLLDGQRDFLADGVATVVGNVTVW